MVGIDPHLCWYKSIPSTVSVYRTRSSGARSLRSGCRSTMAWTKVRSSSWHGDIEACGERGGASVICNFGVEYAKRVYGS